MVRRAAYFRLPAFLAGFLLDPEDVFGRVDCFSARKGAISREARKAIKRAVPRRKP